MFAASAFAAECAAPDGIKLLDERIDEGGIIGSAMAIHSRSLTCGTIPQMTAS